MSLIADRAKQMGMGSMAVKHEEPTIGVEQVERRRSEMPGQWLFKWRVQNKTGEPMNIVSVRVPHGKFKATERGFAPPVTIAPNSDFVLAIAVVCDEPPNTIVENAFLILLAEWQRVLWRLFVRLQIRIDEQRTTDAVTELITIQRAGFSGIS